MSNHIKENLQTIRENIAAAAKISHQDPENIILVGVTKTVAPPDIKPFLVNGGKVLGENKAQELLSKADDPLLCGASWHFIGHLQSNKVKQIINKVDMIQSVDSLSIAEEINKRAEQAGLRMDILVEVNIAEEKSKYGFSAETLERSFDFLLKLPNICVNGLMCMPPFIENVEKNKPLYTKFLNLAVDIEKNFGNNCIKYLSMGTSQDYAYGVSLGINMVRIGTALFGAR
jgi:pyridoxal phosphate enzyme (YggS family)